MATRALARIPLFGALDRSGFGTWTLSALVLLASAALGAAVCLLPSPGLDASTERALAAIVLLDALLIGAAIATTLAIARTTEADLQQLEGLDAGVSNAEQGLAPSARLLGICMAGYTAFAIAFSVGMLSLSTGLSLTEALLRMTNSGLGFFFLSFVMVPVTGALLGVFLAVFICQILVLRRVAETLTLELWRVDRYASITNPAVRFVLLALAFLSVLPLLGVYVESAEFSAVLMKLGLSILAIYAIVIALFLYPVVVLRKRIRRRKLDEIDLVVRALKGEADARAELPPGVTDLVTYRMFLDALWEWPVAAHVQKLVLFGLLPPLGWMVSALLENSLF